MKSDKAANGSCSSVWHRPPSCFHFMILPTLNVFRMSLYERGAYSPNETFVGLKIFSIC